MNSNLLEENIIIAKQSLSWHLISLLLETIHEFHDAMADEKFKRLLNSLEKYVENVILLPDCDIIDSYVTVEFKK